MWHVLDFAEFGENPGDSCTISRDFGQIPKRQEFRTHIEGIDRKKKEQPTPMPLTSMEHRKAEP